MCSRGPIVESSQVLNLRRFMFAVSMLVVASVATSSADAKRNPPGCHNHNAAIHNPNCQGGGGTHVTVTPKPTITNVQTVVVAPVNTQTGQTSGVGAGSTTVTVTANPPQTFTGYSPYYVPTLTPPMVPTPVPQQGSSGDTLSGPQSNCDGEPSSDIYWLSSLLCPRFGP